MGLVAREIVDRGRAAPRVDRPAIITIVSGCASRWYAISATAASMARSAGNRDDMQPR